MGWYTKGFRGSSHVRTHLREVSSLEDLQLLVGRLNLAEPFPAQALRANRAKGNRTQRVKLPEGYLLDLEDDTPPKGPRTAEEIEAWERALSGG